MALFGEYGSSKIGLTEVVTLATATWTEVVLVTSPPTPYPPSAWVIYADTTDVFIAQGNHSTNQNGAAVALPADPSTVASGRQAGTFKLSTGNYWRIDAERAGENSIWLFSKAGGIVRLTEITRVPYDES